MIDSIDGFLLRLTRKGVRIRRSQAIFMLVEAKSNTEITEILGVMRTSINAIMKELKESGLVRELSNDEKTGKLSIPMYILTKVGRAERRELIKDLFTAPHVL